jgi:uncharacterized protein YjiS (DUF1127 family)
MTTIKTLTRRPSSGPAFALDVLRRVADTVAEAWTIYRNRRQMHHLTELDDYLLADIGLTRNDVEEAVSLPLHEDPTRYIALSVRTGGHGVVRHGRPRRGR